MPGVDDVQLRPAPFREIDRRPSGEGRVLHPIGRKQYLLRETVNFLTHFQPFFELTVFVSRLSKQSLGPGGIRVGGGLPLPGLPEDGEHPLDQIPALIRRQVPGVDGLLLGLEPAELGLLGEVSVDDPHHSVDLLAG